MYPEYTHFSVLPCSPLYPYLALIPEKRKEEKRKKIPSQYYVTNILMGVWSNTHYPGTYNLESSPLIQCPEEAISFEKLYFSIPIPFFMSSLQWLPVKTVSFGGDHSGLHYFSF